MFRLIGFDQEVPGLRPGAPLPGACRSPGLQALADLIPV